jgi:hypothetical protein
VYWNKALPPSTEEPTISIADLRQIHFIRTGTYISEDDLPSSLLSTVMLTSRQFYNDDLPSPASTPPSELPVHQTALTPVDIDFAPIGPTILFEDNASAIRMVNSNRPTERSRHIDIAWFAIQDWRAADEIVLKHIKGTINPSDDLTKALGWILHARHSRRLLGHYRPKTLS